MEALKINQLEQLYHHKQEKISFEISRLKKEKNELLSKIASYQVLIQDLHLHHTQCKQQAYGNAFFNKFMSIDEIKKIRSSLQQPLKDISKHKQIQQQITEQINRLDEQIIVLIRQLQFCIIKREKYAYFNAYQQCRNLE